ALTNYYKSVGIYPWHPTGPPKVVKLIANKPAEKSGVAVNDIILKIDDVEIDSSNKLIEYVSARPGEQLKFLIKRNSNELEIVVTPIEESINGKIVGRIGLGPVDTGVYPEDMKIKYQYPPIQALFEAAKKVWVNTKLMLLTFGKMISGSVSIDKISGPITIAKYAGMTASSGFSTFINFLAVVSISIGLINLFPIPILDGGHLFNYLIEIVKGSPVSEKFEMFGQRIGIVVLVMLMSLAIYNDILGILR
ncbi:MAG: RIP metalloprotease RseP, partial [Thiohalomonadales bacterium]